VSISDDLFQAIWRWMLTIEDIMRGVNVTGSQIGDAIIRTRRAGSF
jgi:hypothetical protein